MILGWKDLEEERFGVLYWLGKEKREGGNKED